MSDTQLIEERLRDFLATPNDPDWDDVLRRAAASPAESSSGGSLIAAPHRRRWSRRLALGGMGALVVTGAVAAALVVVFAGTSAPNAFAGWKATPTRPASGQTATALGDCTTRLAAAAPSTAAADWQPLATDTRGPFTAMILRSDDGTATCLTGPSFTTVGVNAAQSQGSQPVLSFGGSSANSVNTTVQVANGADSAPINAAAFAQTSIDGQPYTLLQGRIESGTTRVTLVLSDGSRVQATVAAGALVAWWPNHADVTSAQTTSGSGTSTQQLPFTTKSPSASNPTGQPPNSTIRKPSAGPPLHPKTP